MEGDNRLRRQRCLTPSRRGRHAKASNTADPSPNRSSNTTPRDSANYCAHARESNRVANRICRLINTLVPPEIRDHGVSLTSKRHIRKLQLQLALPIQLTGRMGIDHLSLKGSARGIAIAPPATTSVNTTPSNVVPGAVLLLFIA